MMFIFSLWGNLQFLIEPVKLFRSGLSRLYKFDSKKTRDQRNAGHPLETWFITLNSSKNRKIHYC